MGKGWWPHRGHTLLVVLVLQKAIGRTWPLVDLRAWPSQLEALHPLPIGGMYFCSLFPQYEPFQGLSLEWALLWRLPQQYKPLNPGKAFIYTVKILAGGCRVTVLIAAQDKLCVQISFFIKPASYLSGVVCHFLQSLLSLVYGASFRFHLENYGHFKPTVVLMHRHLR